MVTSLALGALLLSAPAGAQRRTVRTAARSGAEGGLLGVKLFDSGLRVVQLYGNPDQIIPVAGGGNANAGGGGGGGRGGFGGPSGGGSNTGRGASGAPGAAPPPAGSNLPDFEPGFGNFQSQAPPGSFSGGSPSGNNGGGRGAQGGPGAGSPDAGSGGGGGGAGAAASGSSDFTRLVYTKSGSKFGFVLDKFNRVVQIEAIGLQNQRVRTKRGIGFGATFSQVMKAYGVSSAPDGYEVAGDQVTVKWLTRQRVAFRLTKLGTRQAHVVTGIVVAAGKG